MTDTTALLDEVSDWGVQNFPLAGGDVLVMLVKHGFATKEQVQDAYQRAMDRHAGKEWVGEGKEVQFGPATPDGEEIPL